MRFDATPRPSPLEADALAVALERLLGRPGVPASYGSAWRRAGIRENAATGDEGAGPRPSMMTRRPRRA